MLLTKPFVVLYFMLLMSVVSNAQIEVAHISVKNFKATGFAGFLNFSVPISKANYITAEGALQYFKDKEDDEVALIPALLGFRYTLNQTGTGLYVEPNIGYTFGETTIGIYENNTPVADYSTNGWAHEKVAGPAAGIGFGYLFEPAGRVQFNVGLRYEHTFGNAVTNLFALRISHAFTFGRREE
ncbi:hypothetical protein [Segetibacter aerophilus]|nr:hypothetical protein [Segetibacter aerophilus]